MTVRVLTAGGGANWEYELVLACAATQAVQVQRRCYDSTDLLIAADSRLGEVAVVSSDLAWLDHDLLRRLRRALGRVIVVLAPGDEHARVRLQPHGVAEVVESRELVAAVLHAAAQRPSVVPAHCSLLALGDDGKACSAEAHDETGGRPGSLVESSGPGESVVPAGEPGPSAMPRGPEGDVLTEVEAGVLGDQDAGVGESAEHAPIGQIVAVWGPTGAPGRTTVAVNLAFELAAAGRRTLLVDADTYGAAVGQTLGFLTESAGLGGATRLAEQGMLDGERLHALVRRAEPDGPWVLTGLTRPDLWEQASASSWRQVLERCTESFEVTVVDVGFCLEEGGGRAEATTRLDALGSTPNARNAVANATVQEAQLVVAVTRADPVGLAAFLHAQRDLWALGVARDRVALVVNRFRSTLFGATGEAQIQAALRRQLGGSQWVTIPEDVVAFDAALLAGRALREVRRGCAAQRACADLASLVVEHLYGVAAPVVARPRRWHFRRAAEARRLGSQDIRSQDKGSGGKKVLQQVRARD